MFVFNFFIPSEVDPCDGTIGRLVIALDFASQAFDFSESLDLIKIVCGKDAGRCQADKDRQKTYGSLNFLESSFIALHPIRQTNGPLNLFQERTKDAALFPKRPAFPFRTQTVRQVRKSTPLGHDRLIERQKNHLVH